MHRISSLEPVLVQLTLDGIFGFNGFVRGDCKGIIVHTAGNIQEFFGLGRFDILIIGSWLMMVLKHDYPLFIRDKGSQLILKYFIISEKFNKFVWLNINTDCTVQVTVHKPTLKKPTTAMSFSSTKALAASTLSKVLAAGPVFFSNQETIVSAVRPPLYSEAFPFLKSK